MKKCKINANYSTLINPEMTPEKYALQMLLIYLLALKSSLVFLETQSPFPHSYHSSKNVLFFLYRDAKISYFLVRCLTC